MGVVFDRAAERVYLVDEQAKRGAGRQGAAALPAPDQLERPPRPARVPDHRHEPRRPARRGQRARGDPDARDARRPDEGRGGGTASSSRARSAAATSSRSSCPPTTPSRASASCSSCWRRSSGRSRSSSPICPPRRSSTGSCTCPWALKGTVMRAAHRAVPRPRRRPARRDQGLRRARLGAGAARSGRAARPHLRRGRTEEESAGARGRVPADRRGDHADGGNRRP